MRQRKTKPDLDVKLGDFDLATCLKPKSCIKQSLQVETRMAPEIEANEYHDLSADVWSLGQIAFQLLCCANEPCILSEDFSDVPQNVREVWQHEVNSKVRRLVEKMTREDPSERPDLSEIL